MGKESLNGYGIPYLDWIRNPLRDSLLIAFYVYAEWERMLMPRAQKQMRAAKNGMAMITRCHAQTNLEANHQ